MLLIAESGSTKTQWVFVDENNNIKSVETNGLNPYHSSDGDFYSAIGKVISQLDIKSKPIFRFYSAGCFNPINKSRLQKIWEDTKLFQSIDVFDDLTAVLHASGIKKGFVGILGTGANGGTVENSEITNRKGGIGYLLGDEGSGAYLGKNFLKLYFENRLPEEIENSIEDFSENTRAELLRKIYSTPRTGYLLASYAPLVLKWKDTEEVKNIITEGFSQYFNFYRNLITSAETIFFTGSIAKYFYTELSFIIGQHSRVPVQITDNPAMEIIKKYINNKNDF